GPRRRPELPPITPAPGYTVADVAVDGVSVGAVTTYTFHNVTANHTIAATFAPLNYTITATAGANGSITPSGAVSVAHGDDQSFTLTPAPGYTVADVEVDGVSVGAVTTYTFHNVTANHTIAATFVPLNYTITATAGANGSITPSGAVSVAHGDNQSFTLTPAPGYTVADVAVDGVSVGAVTTYTFHNVTANHTIAATFAQVFVQFSAASYSVYEDEGTVTIQVTLNRTSTEVVEVDYATSDITATAGIDYVPASGTLTFNPGDLTQVFTVTVVDNCDLDETLGLTLSNPNNAFLGTPFTATLTIKGAHPNMVKNTSDSGPGSLRQTIADASPGDTIGFCITPLPAVITLTSGQITIDKDLTIDGPGVSLIAISGNNASRVFEMTSGTNIAIDEVTIQEGNVSGDDGGGVLNHGTLTLSSTMVMSSTTTGRGGGIFNDGSLTLVNTIVGGNAADGNGGGIYHESGSLTLTGTTVGDNTANGLNSYGGGIYIRAGSAVLTSTTIRGNETTVDGGGIYHQSGTLALTSSTVSGNTANDDGGGLDNESGDVTITDTIISDNRSLGNYLTGAGGGINNEQTMILINTTVMSNAVQNGDGGGISNRYAGALTLQSSVVMSNTASEDGGGVYNEDGTLALTTTTVSGNTAGSDGGGVYQETGTVTLTGSTISGNTASQDGGGVDNEGGTLTLTSSTVSGNTAGNDGGGIQNERTLELINSIVGENAAAHGGGVNSAGTSAADQASLKVVSTTIQSNTVTLDGGGIRGEYSMMDVENSTISGNQAAQNGGGIFARYLTTEVSNSTITNNEADSNGGGFYVSVLGVDAVTVTQSIIANNRAGIDGPDCRRDFASGGSNVIGNYDGCTGFTDGVNGDQVGSSASPLDPLLGPLQDNGGPTWTHALLPGSPAVDTIPVGACGVATDQRGVARPDGALCDSGAVEYRGIRVQFSATDYTVSERDSTVMINVTLSMASTQSVSVDYTTSDGTATAGSDYVPTSGTLIFLPGMTTQTFTVTVIDSCDTTTPNETVNLSLLNPVRVSPGTPKTATLTIEDTTANKVTNTNNSGSGSLRQVVLNASSGDTILFCTTGVIRLTSGQITINKDLTIDGPGSSLIAISGNNASRIFSINGGVTATIDDVTIQEGRVVDSNGGGILNMGTLYLNATVVQNNRATGSGMGGGLYNAGTMVVNRNQFLNNASESFGGGIQNGGTMTIMDTTVSGNAADSYGGGISTFAGNTTLTGSTLSGNTAENSGGGISTFMGVVVLTNSTVSGNTASNNDGGGIYNNMGQLSLTSSTVSSNLASDEGGGIYYDAGMGFGWSRIKQSVLADNTAPTGTECRGNITSQRYNLVENPAGCTIGGDTTATSPGLTHCSSRCKTTAAQRRRMPCRRAARPSMLSRRRSVRLRPTSAVSRGPWCSVIWAHTRAATAWWPSTRLRREAAPWFGMCRALGPHWT
ncbi:MAG: hypothetical protein HC884_04865, partial [Chloroflexaceae bacterium]|nr:hypothetical protein [Chloroflexaceae bacterium]